MKKISPFIWVSILIGLIVPVVYVFYINGVFDREEPVTETQEQVEEKPEVVEQETEPAITVYDEEPASEGAVYFEKFPIIADQQAYLAFPLEHPEDTPPTLIVYSHGSNTLVTKDLKDPFMKDMQMYGEFFTRNGYAFAASNEHGANWGSDLALQDMENLRIWVGERFAIQERVNLLGFSMGGLPTLYYVMEDNSRVNAVALLAPTTYIWPEEKYRQLEDIPVKVWHGTEDVNIGHYVSELFVQWAEKYGIAIPLVSVDGATHFDIDTELKDEILEFYNQTGVRE